MKKFIAIIVIILILVIGGFLLFRKNGNEVKYRTEKVSRVISSQQ